MREHALKTISPHGLSYSEPADPTPQSVLPLDKCISLPGRLAFAIVSIAVVALMLSTNRAQAQSPTDVTLRDYVYTFSSPGDARWPWHTVKLDVSHAFPRDRVFLHATNGFHDDPFKPAHGEFLRLEDYHRFTPIILAKVAVGAGTGYQPIRSTALEVAVGRPDSVALAIGEVLTSLKNATYQRIFALGPDISADRLTINIRYYHATISTGTVAPPSFTLSAADAITSRLSLGLITDFGGEVGGDRTASQLPTSSGLFGPSVGLFATYGPPRLRLVGGYQEGVYRSYATGAFVEHQYVASFGLSSSIGRAVP